MLCFTIRGQIKHLKCSRLLCEAWFTFCWRRAALSGQRTPPACPPVPPPTPASHPGIARTSWPLSSVGHNLHRHEIQLAPWWSRHTDSTGGQMGWAVCKQDKSKSCHKARVSAFVLWTAHGELKMLSKTFLTLVQYVCYMRQTLMNETYTKLFTTQMHFNCSVIP